ncbi:NAD(P)H-dependent oxidoreductase [Mesorhizobium sp. NBSH29]|uniref:NADPH-dependent FMN reductase n=1 Tax=Mesorhizobium sp. NBSH29 TaxID=2654249 RepID=UPI0018967D4C|nr:NADPH-dependent FMN reductase [Mesorhizobium sp. NBSH29]QPC87661.1 NAD(P)H-dependent oxidoreductase [Mesorhizobium sp. NBSH29]
MKVLAMSGSLRAASINSALLRAARTLAPSGMVVDVFCVGDLPFFNPDLESRPPAAVELFYRQIESADALLIASPEYAHGVTGSIKNALDWLVGHPPFVYKTVAVFNASPRAHHADDALREILNTMNANLVGRASASIPLLGSGLDEQAMVNTPAVADAIRATLMAISDAVAAQQA